MASRAGQEKALRLLRHLPRVALNNINHPNPKPANRRKRGAHGGDTHGAGDKGAKARQNFVRAGFEGGQTPFYLRIPREDPYRGHHLRRQYPPVSLHQLQLMVDTDRVDPTHQIDITQICNSGLFKLEPMRRQFGFQLTDEGMDDFECAVNLEVQWASERVISAVEKAGGTITTAFYDVASLQAAVDPERFFKRGVPIPRRALPPQDAIGYYTDPCARGYLADPEQIARHRLTLAQKYGYQLPDVQEGVLTARKDPRQIFFGLEPGWLVNLADKQVWRIKDPAMSEYYRS